jgi:hypothetical protein
MKKETLDLLANAISDVGHWRYWGVENDICQIEFGATQLLDGDSINENSKSAVIALRYYENAFLIFYDNEEEENWHNKLRSDEIAPFNIDYDFFVFNEIRKFEEIESAYKNKIIIKKAENLERINNILIFKAENVAVAIGGNRFAAVDYNGEIDENKIIERNKLWWAYWKDYYKKRETKRAYKKDFVCEVTIPMKP